MNFEINIPEINEDSFDFKKSNKKHETSEKYNKKVRLFLEKNYIFETKHIKKNTYQYIYDINKLKLPGKGEQLRIRTQQQINLITIILKIADKYKIIEEITIATYTLNRESLSILIQLVNKNKIKRLNLLIASSYIFRHKKYYEEIKEICKKTKNVHLTFAWCHMKITVIKAKGNYYQFEGSMNYSTNNMAEQLVFENNKETYDFDYNFINEVMKNRTNKSLEIIC